MIKKKAKTKNRGGRCCRVESVVAVDERGQMVLPKDLRQKAGIKPGNKLGVVSCEREGKICCLMLMKMDDLAGWVQNFLGPVMKDMMR